MQLIPTNTGRANDINDSGMAVGLEGASAYRWSAAGGVESLAIAGQRTFANAINNIGQVAGGAGIESCNTQPLIWDAARTPQYLDLSGMLATLGSYTQRCNGIATGINESGISVGSIFVDLLSEDDGEFAFKTIAPSDQTISLGELPRAGGPRTTRPYGINNAETVVGFSNERAFVWTASAGIVDLNSLLNDDAIGWTLDSPANAINDAGQIVGAGRRDGAYRAIILTPDVPLPDSPTLALAAKALLDFGVVATGQSAVRTIRVQNAGTGLLQVTTAPPSPYMAVAPVSLSLPAGAIGDLKVAFKPSALGRQDATILIQSNGGNATVEALGYAVKPTRTLPVITLQVPASAAPNSIVSLKGRALGWTFGTVQVAGQTVNSIYWSDTAVDVVVPELPAGLYPLSVTTADGRVGSGQLTIMGPSPVITRLRPRSGTSRSNLVITGANFGYSAADVAVTIGGSPANVVEWTTDWLRVEVPQVSSALHPVEVTTNAGTAASSFRVRPLLVTVEYGECLDYFAGVFWGLLEAPCPPVIATVTAGTATGTTTVQLQNLTAKWYSVIATSTGIGEPVVVSPWIGPKAELEISNLVLPTGAFLSIVADGTTLEARAIAVVDGMLSLCPALGVRCPRMPATADALELVKFTLENSSEFLGAVIEVYEAVGSGDMIDAYNGISDLLVLAVEDPYVGALFRQLGMDVDTASANRVTNFLRVFRATALAMESVFAPPIGTVIVQAK
jgi:hypothetical protein